jgi:phosphatidylglycerophosphate synthase
MFGPLQVLIQDSGAGRLIAGLPSALRAAHRAAVDLSPAKIVFCGSPADFSQRYDRQLKGLGPMPMPCANGGAAGQYFDPSGPLLILAPDGFPHKGALALFVTKAQDEGQPARWVQSGRTVAAYYPHARDILDSAETADALARRALQQPLSASGDQTKTEWLDAAQPESILKAEDALCAGLRHERDGYLARFDRRISIALSRAMLDTPVTPNHITSASLVLGLLGAWWLASGTQSWQLAGALVLWFCCILDGCDGEVARLKLLCSPSGAAYDLWADHLAHLATFIAIPIGVHRMFPEKSFLLPGILLVSGVSACGFSVWWLLLRKPESERGPHSIFIERVASRDYAYLIVILAAIGRLDWFLWAAGMGSWIFGLSLWLIPRPPSAA